MTGEWSKFNGLKCVITNTEKNQNGQLRTHILEGEYSYNTISFHPSNLKKLDTQKNLDSLGKPITVIHLSRYNPESFEDANKK